MDKLKPCEKCGGTNLSKRLIAVRCLDCGHLEYLNEWNRRAMPECVRDILRLAEQRAEDIDDSGDGAGANSAYAKIAAVNKYYAV